MTKKDKLGIGLLACALLAVSALVAAPIIHSKGTVELDPETLCPADGTVMGHVVVLVDATDVWSTAQLDKLKKILARTARELGRGQKLSIHEIPAVAPTLPAPVFARCSPGGSRDSNPFVEGAKVLDRKQEETFLKPVQAYLNSLSGRRSAPTTPLLEVLKAVTERPDFRNATGRRAVVIFSDFLENWKVSHYRGFDDYGTFAKTPYGSSLVPSLSGAAVDFYYLLRPSAALIQGQRHVQWWAAHIAAGGGTVRIVEPVVPDISVARP